MSRRRKVVLATHLKNMLADKALVSPRKDGSTVLREKNVMELEVADIPSDITIINMRRIGSLSGVKEGEWKQVCDYLFLFEEEGEDYAVFVELKKTLNEENEKGMEQLRRSFPFLEYLRSVCEIHHSAESAKLRIIVRYSLVGNQISQRLDKQHVKAGFRLPSKNHKGISVDMLFGERIRFRSLIDE